MGVIRPGDEALHYSDGTHRWISPGAEPTDEEERSWRAVVAAHLDEHRTTMDGPRVRGRGRTVGAEGRGPGID